MRYITSILNLNLVDSILYPKFYHIYFIVPDSCNRRTAFEWSAKKTKKKTKKKKKKKTTTKNKKKKKTTAELKLVLLGRNLALNSDAASNYKYTVGLPQSAFYVNLYRAVIGPSG